MREIKFRAYQDNEMLFSPISSNYGLNRFFGMLYEDTKIMQFTGLQDKMGANIYEGDILNFRANYTDKPCGYFEGVVEITPLKLIITVNSLEYDAEEECEGLDYNSEVMGNIYENKNK